MGWSKDARVSQVRSLRDAAKSCGVPLARARNDPPVDKAGLKARVRALCRTQRAQNVAKAHFRNLRRVCQEVVAKKGARARG